jgi:hypothetical protein
VDEIGRSGNTAGRSSGNGALVSMVRVQASSSDVIASRARIWYASTAWYGLTVDIDLYDGATHVADLASETKPFLVRGARFDAQTRVHQIAEGVR